MATSSPSSSSLPPPPAQEQRRKGAYTCLQVLQAATTLLSTHAQDLCQLAEGRDKGTAAATLVLKTLRDALDKVLEDGGSNDSAKRQRPDSAPGNKLTAYPLNAITFGMVCPTACARVLLHDPHLLTSIIGCLVHERHSLPSRVALGLTALVSNEWRRTSRQICFWRPLAQELMAATVVDDESVMDGRDPEDYYKNLCSYGKCLRDRSVVTGHTALLEGLELHMEVRNAAAPSGRFYSALGPIGIAEPARSNPNIVILRIVGPQRKEIAGPAFSAAILDPEHQRYSTLASCLTDAQDASNPLQLCVRMRVIDRQTGKTALLWSSDKSMRYYTEGCAQWVRDTLPRAAHYFRSAGWTHLHRRGKNHERQEEISAYVGLPLQVLPGQVGVSDAEKKYVVGILPQRRTSLVEIIFNSSDAKAVATFVRSLLE